MAVIIHEWGCIMSIKDARSESIWKYIIRIAIKPLIFFIVLSGVISYWNAQNAEIHKVVYKEIEQQIHGLTLMGTKEQLKDVLKRRDKDARAWLSESFESNYEQKEIVDFYEKMLSDAAWSKFEHKEYYSKYKTEDRYVSKKNGYTFNLSFNYNTTGEVSDKDKCTKYHINIRGYRDYD